VTYSRATSSPRYIQLVDFYTRMHADGGADLEAKETFDGASVAPHILRIRTIIGQYRS
jgi:hypothetical protein